MTSEQGESISDRVKREHEEENQRWREGAQKARNSRFAILKVSERRYAIIQDSGATTGSGAAEIWYRSWRFREGWERRSWDDVRKEIVRLQTLEEAGAFS